MEYLNQLGIPIDRIIGVIVSGGFVWATIQAVKTAIRKKKEKYLLYAALVAIAVSAMATISIGEWDWKYFGWTVYGSWLCSTLGHKFYAKFLKRLIEKEPKK